MTRFRILMDTAGPDGGNGGGNGNPDGGGNPPTNPPVDGNNPPADPPAEEEEPAEFIPALIASLGIDVPLTDSAGNRLYVGAEGTETIADTARFIKENVFDKLKAQASQEVSRQLNVLDQHFLDFTKFGGTVDAWKNHLGEITYSRVVFNSDEDPLRKEFAKTYLISLGLEEDSANQLIEANSRDKAVWKNYTDSLLTKAQSKQAEKAQAIVAAQELTSKKEQEELVKFFTGLTTAITKDGAVPNTQIFIPEADRATVVEYLTKPVQTHKGIYTQAQIDMEALYENPTKWAQTAILINHYGDKLNELLSTSSKGSINKYFKKPGNTPPPGGNTPPNNNGGFKPTLFGV